MMRKVDASLAIAAAAMLFAPASAQAQSGLTVTSQGRCNGLARGNVVHQMTVSLGTGQDSVGISIRVHPMAQTI